jgi:outer membrane lipoprotein
MLGALGTAVGFLLAACAGTPVLDAAGVDQGLTPALVAAQPQRSIGRRVVWGGGIVSSVNRASRTELDLLAYPLREDQRPDDRAAPLGRFRVSYPGYLETADFAQGRRVTVRGRILEVKEERAAGRPPDRRPVIEAETVHLWPVGESPDWRPWPVQLGIGIWISN